MNDRKIKTEEELSNVFVDFRDEFERQNIYLKLAIGIVSVLSVISITLILLQENIHVFQDLPFLNKGIPPEKICYFGMKSVLKNNGNIHIVDESLLKAIKKKKISFSFAIKEWFRPLMLNDEVCRIAFEDDKGLVGFKVKIKTKSGYPFDHKIYDFDEISINKETL
ncbi:MAG: hypothetical protein KAQ98_13260 [Bacteriovoracaceae bacterium]|nr:hypothetical protein [Bacteriovoracaceae bacterium]